MTPRIAIAGISHETNTYCKEKTRGDKFGLLRGQAADPPGLTTLHIEIFPRKKKPGPLWPVDPDVRYEQKN